MVIVVSVLVIAAMVTVFMCSLVLVRRLLRWARAQGRSASSGRPVDRTGTPIAFGTLPSLCEPVGPLGSPAPDAEISTDATNASDIYGV
jgi:hypothetical protein